MRNFFLCLMVSQVRSNSFFYGQTIQGIFSHGLLHIHLIFKVVLFARMSITSCGSLPIDVSILIHIYVGSPHDLHGR